MHNYDSRTYSLQPSTYTQHTSTYDAASNKSHSTNASYTFFEFSSRFSKETMESKVLKLGAFPNTDQTYQSLIQTWNCPCS